MPSGSTPEPVKFTVSGVGPSTTSAAIAADGAASVATPFPTQVSSSSSNMLFAGPPVRCLNTRYTRCAALSVGVIVPVTWFAMFALPLVGRSIVPTSGPSTASSRTSIRPPAPPAV